MLSDISNSIRREDTATKGRYIYTAEAGLPEAELTFSKLGTTQIIIDHTEVPDVFRGQGVGLALGARAVAAARDAGLKFTPLCPLAAAQFRLRQDWHGVLAH